MWEMTGISVCGPVREHNEDTIDCDPSLGLMVLADGLGGHNAGEVASAITVTQVIGQLRARLAHGNSADVPTLCRWLREASESANAEVFALAQEDNDYTGMGSTLVAVALTPKHACIAHVGDSRAYVLRNGQLQLLTRDHTLLQQQIDLGLVKEAYPGENKGRSALTRAVGTKVRAHVDIGLFGLEAADVVMVASDGLFEPAPDNQVISLLNQDLPLAKIATELVGLAIRWGSDDNISVILARRYGPL